MSSPALLGYGITVGTIVLAAPNGIDLADEIDRCLLIGGGITSLLSVVGSIYSLYNYNNLVEKIEQEGLKTMMRRIDPYDSQIYLYAIEHRKLVEYDFALRELEAEIS